MASGLQRHDTPTASEAARVSAAVLIGRATPPALRPIDERLMSDFCTAVNALPWASTRHSQADLIESFVRLGWLRRDGEFTGLSEEGARRYAAAAMRG